MANNMHDSVISFSYNRSRAESISTRPTDDAVTLAAFRQLDSCYALSDEAFLQFLGKLTSPMDAIQINFEEYPGDHCTFFEQHRFLCIYLQISSLPLRHPTLKAVLDFCEQLPCFRSHIIPYRSKGQKGCVTLIHWSTLDGLIPEEEIETFFVDNSSVPVSAMRLGIGLPHRGFNGIYSSYFEANSCYFTNYLMNTTDFRFRQMSSYCQTSTTLIGMQRMIVADITYQMGRSCIMYADQWFELYRKTGNDLQALKCDVILLYAEIKNTIFANYVLKNKKIKNGMEMYEIMNIQSFQEMRSWFLIWLTYTLDNFELKKGISFDLPSVQNFIQQHISDDISLTKVASYFYMNPSYFSRKFKESFGQTFMHYVTEQKMLCARELLQSNRQVSIVAQILGYNDVKHFRLLYKKYFGEPPKANHKTSRS